MKTGTLLKTYNANIWEWRLEDQKFKLSLSYVAELEKKFLTYYISDQKTGNPKHSMIHIKGNNALSRVACCQGWEPSPTHLVSSSVNQLQIPIGPVSTGILRSLHLPGL